MDDNNPFSNVVWWFKTRDTGELAFIGILALLAIILVYVLLTSGGDSDEDNALANDITTAQVTTVPTVPLAPTPTTIVIPTPMASTTPKPNADDLVAGADNADKVETPGAAKNTPTPKPTKAPASSAPAPSSGGTRSTAPASGGATQRPANTGGTTTNNTGGTAANNTGGTAANNTGGTAANNTGGTTANNTGGTAADTGGTTANNNTGTANQTGGDTTNTISAADATATAEATPEATQVPTDPNYVPPDAGLSHGTCDGVITFGGLCDDGTGYDNALNNTGGATGATATPDPDNTTGSTPEPTVTAGPTTEPSNEVAGASATSTCDNGYRTVNLNMVNNGTEAKDFIVSYQVSTGSIGTESFTVDPGAFKSGSVTGVSAGATEIQVTVGGVAVLTESFAACG